MKITGTDLVLCGGRCATAKPVGAFGLKCGRPRERCKECVAADERDRYLARQSKREEALPESLPALLPFGTPIQRASAEALIRCGSVAAAAEELKINVSALRAHLTELERRAARRGFAPDSDMSKPTPEGFHTKGVSTLYGPEGEIRQQWVKTQVDPEDRLARLADALQALAEPYAGLCAPIAPPARADADLLCVYPMGDPHFGMLSWALETGDDFDLKIAEADLFGAVDALVSIAPAAEEALIIDLGDFFHTDNSSNQTARSHHALDVDSRWSKILRIGVKALRRCIDRALEKHARVRVVIVIGNHDDHSSQMLAIVLDAAYENEPRVTIDTSPSKFHWHEFGLNLIGITHGDTVKAGDLLGVMAHDQAPAWGRTKYRRWYCGHVHHDSVKEYPGVTVETFRTLAGRDAWHHGKGYRSGQDMKVDVVHRTDGWITRNTVGIPAIRRRAQP